MKSCLMALSLFACVATARHSGKHSGRKSAHSSLPDPPNAVCIFQADFDQGTLIIDTPGSYRLCEDITFNPNPPTNGLSPAEAFAPVAFDDLYDENSFGLGFFAAIVIVAHNVDIFLDGYTLEQSKGHALMQRFYSNIELSSAPFTAGAGPAQFVGEGDEFRAASNIRILGPGTLGRSSHHGIHGNNNANIEIHGVTFRDFEVAAISINNVDGLKILDNNVKGNRKDVPISGLFSAARFISPYGKVLKDLGYKMPLRGQMTSAAELYDSLVASIENVFYDVVDGKGIIDHKTHKMEYDLFDNPFRVIDGPCYAFLVHGIGPAVGGQGFSFDPDTDHCSSAVVIKKNDIKDIQCWTKEIPAAVVNGTVQNDARGAVFQWIDTVDGKALAINDDGTYKGNVVADMQIMVAKAIHDGTLSNTDLLQTGVNTIDPLVVQWAESGDLKFDPKYRCDGDSMHHVAKGMIMIRVEDTQGFDIRHNSIRRIKSYSLPPFGSCTDFHAGQSAENPAEQQIGNVRVISIAATRAYDEPERQRDCTIHDNKISKVQTENGRLVVGIDIQGDASGIDITRNKVKLKRGKGRSSSEESSPEEVIGLRVRENVDGPTVHIDDSNKISPLIQILANERRLRKPFHGSPHGHDLEWEYGGCPFANKRGTVSQ